MYKIDNFYARANVEIELKHEDGRRFYTKWELCEDDALTYNDYKTFDSINISEEEAHNTIKDMYRLYVESVISSYPVENMTMSVFNNDDEECYTYNLKDCNYEINSKLEELLKQPTHVLLNDLEWGNIVALDCVVDEYELGE